MDIRINGARVEPVDPKPAVGVERFYDRSLRLWTLYTVDEDGNQVGEAQYGIRADADIIEADLRRELED